jgi:uncharacterized protein YggE
MPVLRHAAFALVLSLAFPAQAQDRSVPQVTVLGEATLRMAPDLAVVRAGVTTQARTAREAVEANNKLMNAVVAAAKAAGIADNDVQTSQFSIQPVHDQSRNAPPRIVAFEVSNQVAARLHDAKRVAEVLDRLIAAGANDISGIEFRVAEPAKALDKVRAAAIADARRKAEIYAGAAGVTLGPAILISEETSVPRPVIMRSAAPDAARSVPISPGEAELRVTVTVSFSIAGR